MQQQAKQQQHQQQQQHLTQQLLLTPLQQCEAQEIADSMGHIYHGYRFQLCTLLTCCTAATRVPQTAAATATATVAATTQCQHETFQEVNLLSDL